MPNPSFTVTSRCASRNRWDVQFGLEIAEMAPAPSFEAAGSCESLERMAAFLRGAFLPELDLALELRLLCDPHAVLSRRAVRVGFRVRVSHRDLPLAEERAGRVQAALVPGLEAACVDCRWIPLAAKSDFDGLFDVFTPGGIGEVLHRVEDISLACRREDRLSRHMERPDIGEWPGVPDDRGPAGSAMIAAPFIPGSAPFGRLAQLLLLGESPVAVSLALAPTRLTCLEKEWLRGQIRLGEAYMAEPSSGTSGSPGVRSEAAGILAQRLDALETLSDAAFLLKVQIAAPGPVSEALLGSVGAVLCAPAGFRSREGREGGWSQAVRGGFDVRSAREIEDLRVALQNLERIAFDPWPGDRRHGRLEALAGVAEAAGLLGFECPAGGMPGFDSSSRYVPARQTSGDEGVIIGSAAVGGRSTPMRLSDDDRRRHVYIVGQTGTGKTSLMVAMAAHDIASGGGVAVLDPHGDMVRQLLPLVPENRRCDLIHVDFGREDSGVRLNLLEHSDLMERDMVINHVFEVFNLLYDMRTCGGPVFELYMRAGMLLAMADTSSPGTLLDVVRIFTSADEAARRLAACKEPFVREAWDMMRKVTGEGSIREIAPYIVSKLNMFVHNTVIRAIVSESRSSIRFGEIMDGRKILLVDLGKGRIGKTFASFLGLIVVSQLLRATLRRGTDAPDFHLYVDEFQNLAIASFAEMLAESRKYHLCAVLANQFLEQVPEEVRNAILGNVGTIMAMRVGPNDAEALEQYLTPEFRMQDLTRLPVGRACVSMLSGGRKLPGFSLQTSRVEPLFPAGLAVHRPERDGVPSGREHDGGGEALVPGKRQQICLDEEMTKE